MYTCTSIEYTNARLAHVQTDIAQGIQLPRIPAGANSAGAQRDNIYLPSLIRNVISSLRLSKSSSGTRMCTAIAVRASFGVICAHRLPERVASSRTCLRKTWSVSSSFLCGRALSSAGSHTLFGVLCRLDRRVGADMSEPVDQADGVVLLRVCVHGRPHLRARGTALAHP